MLFRILHAGHAKTKFHSLSSFITTLTRYHIFRLSDRQKNVLTPCRLSSVVLSSTWGYLEFMTEFEKKELQQMGARLRFFRLEKKMSQESFADLTNLDRTYISGLERGKRNPSYLILKRIAEVLSIKPQDLFNGENNESEN